ncbi:MAG TPA: alpha-L-fucosidase [Candidatus Paceibacterota bacterium]|nr:alpha-L-fucosidase [Verrucomicrobiota bacterium]HOX02249.1 alpha-L-fucosidase [Verrucomicrobiota bacterium]HRZ46079.1 alpha-L-fucosidase [Candidatus Paceibacterota bacterium]HRZ93652.1 alpha-L-fucosidase [Candidatus Paceibacterota bacterium]
MRHRAQRFFLAHLAIAICVAGSAALLGAGESPSARTNRTARLEWFRDQGFGLFIHWSHDSQLGSVISHSMVGADEDYLRRFVEDLPRTFNPRKFNPHDWAALAKLAGIRYVVFTAKHHSGFCMWPTATTDFGIRNTPFRRDIVGEVIEAFRAQGIVPGLYFSPDDFWWLWRHGVPIQRGQAEVQPRHHPGLMAHDQAQVRELLTRYGEIGVLFFDGEAEGLRDLAWELQPDVVVTRGAIETPEQFIPGQPLEGAWEACLTMGTQWQYKPANESYKSGWECLSLLIETRAKGGNLLLNVGPKPDGDLPIEQEERLREIALWMFVNGECIHGVRPWIVTNEKEIWFTRKRDADILYAIVKLPPSARWKYGEWKELVLQSVQATDQTRVRVLGQSGRVLEYKPAVVPQTTWRQEADGLHIRAMRAQRLYNDHAWPNPVVLELSCVRPAERFLPVPSGPARKDAGKGAPAP